MYFLFVLISTYLCIVESLNFMGCYHDLSGAKTLVIDKYISQQQQCVDLCHSRFYRYAFIRETGNCICGNYLGDQKSAERCVDFCHDCEQLKPYLADVFYTGITVSGPPRNLTVSNVTDTEARLDWTEPESYLNIEKYLVHLTALHTYSTNKLPDPQFEYANNTVHVELASLNPATIYNVSVQAMPYKGQGAAVAHSQFETQMGDPDNAPEPPQVLKRDGATMTVRFQPVTNNNGPVTSYLVAVINSGSIQIAHTDNLKAYYEARNDGLTYYIAAELKPEKIKDEFVVGDEVIYGRYLNAPLEPDTNYHVILGVTSQLGSDRRVLYSAETKDNVVMLKMPEQDIDEGYGVMQDKDAHDVTNDSPALVIALSVGIGLISCLLIMGIAGFFVLRNKIKNRHRRRLNNVQELTIQGPMIDVANGGYIPEDEAGASPGHYDQLKERVWLIPQSALNVQQTVTLGAGQFGRVFQGSLSKRDSKSGVDINTPSASNGNVLSRSSNTTVAVYVIHDKRLSSEVKRSMLRALDVSIRAQRHDNLVSLVGTTEFPDSIAIVLEYAPISLKEWLLNSRVADGTSFSTLTEAQALSFGSDIAAGLCYLHQRCRIVHRDMCAQHVYVATTSEGPDAKLQAKVGGFGGVARYYRTEFAPHPVRWQALELLRGSSRENAKSDIWAYACVLWEICALGATPYGNTSTSEVPSRVIAGMRLPQLRYVHDTLYQLMLNCWQLDPDERPTAADLQEAIESLRSDTFMSHIVFDLREPRFDYEQYYPEMESTASPIL